VCKVQTCEIPFNCRSFPFSVSSTISSVDAVNDPAKRRDHLQCTLCSQIPVPSQRCCRTVTSWNPKLFNFMISDESVMFFEVSAEESSDSNIHDHNSYITTFYPTKANLLIFHSNSNSRCGHLNANRLAYTKYLSLIPLPLFLICRQGRLHRDNTRCGRNNRRNDGNET
jgi:hypothetical protein